MNARTSFPLDPPPLPAGDTAAERTLRARAVAGRQMAVLERLADAGMTVVAAIEREARAYLDAPHTAADTAPEATGADDAAEDLSDSLDDDAPHAPSEATRPMQGLAMAYARAARAVRLTLALQSRVLRELEEVERQGRSNAWPDQCWLKDRRAERGARIGRILARVIDAAEPEDDERAQALRTEAGEKLADADVYGDAAVRPMGEIVARICADLGLSPDWSALAREAWAEAEAQGGDPASPFAPPPLTSQPGAARPFRSEWALLRQALRDAQPRGDSS
jgi:hypothetical protein